MPYCHRSGSAAYTGDGSKGEGPLTVDEDRQQTQAIHQQQRLRHTLDGQLDELQRAASRTLHHNAQRLLRGLRVINPYADQLTFIDHQTRNRRDHQAYLTLIDTITYKKY